VPAAERGAASGVRATGMNAGMVLSMGGFFTLMAIGLASRLPDSMYAGLTRLGVTPDAAHTISQTPPVGTLFAAFLGDNPVRALMEQVDPGQLQPGNGVDVATLTGRSFFPHLLADPFRHGLAIAFGVSIGMLLIAAVASLLRGERYVHAEPVPDAEPVAHAMTTGLAREAAALDGIPDQDVAYSDALHRPAAQSAG
jgi:hypothetical protein